MSKSNKSPLYTLLGWVVFSLAKRQAKKRLHIGGSGSGKGKKLLLAGAGVAAVGGAAYMANSSSSHTPS